MPGRSVLALAALLSAASLSAGALAGCHKAEDAPKVEPAAEEAKPAAPVAAAFAKIEARKISGRIEVSGSLDPQDRSEVASQASGAVRQVLVDLGSRVKTGDLLVEIDGREAGLRLSAAAATTEQQKARLGLKRGERFEVEDVPDVKAAREGRDLAVAEFERAEKLHAEGAISQSNFDQAKSAKERAEAQYDMARNGAEQAYAALSAAQSQAGLSAKMLDDTKIRAPFDGVVVERRISPGEFASPGRVVIVLVNDAKLRFRFDVAEVNAAELKNGQKVELTVAAHPGKTFVGEINRVGGSLRAQSRTLPIEAEVDNADGALKPGYFARGSVVLGGDTTEALTVPRSAVAKVASGDRVFVKSGDRVTERLVVVGASGDDWVEIRGPVQAGEEVAVDHLDELSDGATIQ